MTTGRTDPARRLEVAPERIAAWLSGFADRHGELAADAIPAGVSFRAADGSRADCDIPFPPLPGAGQSGPAPGSPAPGSPAPGSPAPGGPAPGSAAPGGVASTDGPRIAAHALADRTVAVLLVRLGGYAAGVFAGPGAELVASKVGARLVHGRSAAGGTSQHRFARRRENQAAVALRAAADTAATVFAPYAGRLDAVVLGGDRRAVAGLRSDPRLAPYLALAVDRFLTVPDPRLAVLRSAPRLFRAIRITITETEPGRA